MHATDVKPIDPGVAEIIAVGNELLNGSVQDGNSFWLIQRIMELGGVVRRTCILPDDQAVIAQEVRSAVTRTMGRPADVLLLTGGLGPTRDDLTVAAVADGIGLPLRLHEQAREMIRRSYDELAANGVLAQGGLNPPREKMALLPEGAAPLSNPAGTAPGVMVRHGRTTIVCFPGVPEEMRQIFQTSLQPHLVDVFPTMHHARRRLRIFCNDESLLAPHLQRFDQRYPLIHVKALSGVIADNPRLEFVFSTLAEDPRKAEAILEGSLDDLRQWLASVGIKVQGGTAEGT